MVKPIGPGSVALPAASAPLYRGNHLLSLLHTLEILLLPNYHCKGLLMNQQRATVRLEATWFNLLICLHTASRTNHQAAHAPLPRGNEAPGATFHRVAFACTPSRFEETPSVGPGGDLPRANLA